MAMCAYKCTKMKLSEKKKRCAVHRNQPAYINDVREGFATHMCVCGVPATAAGHKHATHRFGSVISTEIHQIAFCPFIRRLDRAQRHLCHHVYRNMHVKQNTEDRNGRSSACVAKINQEKNKKRQKTMTTTTNFIGKSQTENSTDVNCTHTDSHTRLMTYRCRKEMRTRNIVNRIVDRLKCDAI